MSTHRTHDQYSCVSASLGMCASVYTYIFVSSTKNCMALMRDFVLVAMIVHVWYTKQARMKKKNKLELRVSFCNWHNSLHLYTYFVVFSAMRKLSSWNREGKQKITWHDSLFQTLLQLFCSLFILIDSIQLQTKECTNDS